MQPETKHFYEFGAFRLDPSEKILSLGGESIALAPKVFDTLEVFVRNAGRLIEKDELMRLIWQDRFVEEGNLAFNVKVLRKALGDSASEPQFIETVPRRGYRFVAQVKNVSANNSHEQKNLKEISFNENTARLSAEISPDGDSSNKKSTVEASLPSSFSIRSRPILYSLGIILIGFFLLTGFLFLKNQNSFLQRFKTSADARTGFLTVEKLTDTGDANSVKISPDGKLLAYYTTVEGGKNTIWLRQFATGKSVPVLTVADESINGVSFSRDGEFINYLHQRKDAPMQLSRISILGGTPTLILNDFHSAYGFSPDNHQIAFTRIDESGSSLMIADGDGHNEQLVFSTRKPRYIISIAWSPDGKSIAYLAGNGEFRRGGKDFGVMEFNLESKTDNSLTDFKWNNLETISWLPDKSGLLVSGREKAEDTDQIWRVSLPDGQAEPITDDSNSLTFSSASNDFSRIIATENYLNASIWVAPKENLNDARPVAKSQGDVAWTRDGKIMFPARDTIKTDIWMSETDGGDKKQLTADDFLERYPVASPDGRFIAFVSNQSGRQNIWRMDADGGNPVQITNGAGESYPVFTPDSQWIVFNQTDDGSLWRIPTGGGEAARLSEEKINRISISPDGTKFAYYGRHDNKRRLIVKSFPECSFVQEFDIVINRASAPKVVWATDGKSLTYENIDFNFVGNLWQQSLDGGEPQQLTNFTSEQILDFSFSPDGNRLALARGTRNSDAVLLKGFK